MEEEDTDGDTINLDDEETVDYNIKSDIESLENRESTTDLDDNEEYFSPLEEKKFFPLEKINYSKPYDKLKIYHNLDKNSEDFAIKWLQISIKDLGYKENQTNFNSFTNDDLIKYRDNLNQIHASSSKRTSNKYIQHYDNDIKNQLKIINDKIGKNKSKKEIEEEKKYEKDVKENRKMTDHFKITKRRDMSGKGVKKGGNNSLIYYNKPQQLIDRLRLLVGSKKAGNTNPEIDNEIIGISDELVKKGLIMNEDYTRFMDKNFIKY